MTIIIKTRQQKCVNCNHEFQTDEPSYYKYDLCEPCEVEFKQQKERVK
tara:strand:- start:7 stop:150 length:144 start_codon:yes stop_codon:yes gene_type:complete